MRVNQDVGGVPSHVSSEVGIVRSIFEVPLPWPVLCLCLSIPGTGQRGGFASRPSPRGVPAVVGLPSTLVGCSFVG